VRRIRKEMFNFRNVSHESKLEFYWTLIPGVILFLLAAPSFSLLYRNDNVLPSEYTVKVTGNQWFWTYEHRGVEIPQKFYTKLQRSFDETVRMNLLQEAQNQYDSVIRPTPVKLLNAHKYSSSVLRPLSESVTKASLSFPEYKQNFPNNPELSYVRAHATKRLLRTLIPFAPKQTPAYHAIVAAMIMADTPLTRSYKYDSYILPESDTTPKDPRLLKTTKPLVLIENVNTRLLVTSTDVLHSFSIPAFGVKVDAVPGRLNQIGITPRRGVFFGMCSELCGSGHGRMPIEAVVVTNTTFNKLLFTTPRFF